MPVFRLPNAFAPRNAPVLLNALAFLSLAVLMPSAANAAPPPPLAQVVVGGILIHIIRTPWAGHSPQERADEVQLRLNTALGQGPITPKDITVAKVQDDVCVLFRGRRLLTADALSARQQHTDPTTLADQWAAHLRQVLPELTRPH